MKGIILAAGRGSRMNVLTADRPKALVKLMGRALLEWQLEAMKCAGIDRVAVVRGYLGDQFESYDVQLMDNKDWQTTNMVASLRCADALLAEHNCIVSYSDIFYSTDSVRRLVESKAPIAVAYDPHWRQLWERRFDNPLSDAETFKLDPEGLIIEIGRRPESFAEIEGQYMGLLRITPEGWSRIVALLDGMPSEAARKIDMTSMLQQLIALGTAITGIRIEEPWGEIDASSDLALYEQMANEPRYAGLLRP